MGRSATSSLLAAQEFNIYYFTNENVIGPKHCHLHFVSGPNYVSPSLYEREPFWIFECRNRVGYSKAEVDPGLRLTRDSRGNLPWVANKRFEISKFKFKFPRARTYEIMGLVLGCIEARFSK